MINWSQEIVKWQLDVFGHTPTSLVKARKEFAELEKAISSGAAPFDIALEAADVVICLAGFVHTLGFSLARAVVHKMVVNRERVWHEQEDGTFQHVKDVEWL